MLPKGDNADSHRIQFSCHRCQPNIQFSMLKVFFQKDFSLRNHSKLKPNWGAVPVYKNYRMQSLEETEGK